uniref:sterol 26-hydroxylase, mitochondrial n=1 Tax=Myxine glutinosa TaxID=7769 RepID=UPI00358E0A4C
MAHLWLRAASRLAVRPLPGNVGRTLCSDPSSLSMRREVEQPRQPSLGQLRLEDLPGPSASRMLHWILLGGYRNRTCDLQIKMKELYGPLCMYKFGKMTVVNVARADLIEEVIRQDGIYPQRSDMSHWQEFRDMRGYSYGPLTAEGSSWHRFRTVLNKRMLRPNDVVSYAKPLNAIVTDFLARLQRLRAASSDGDTVTDLANELYKFAFEGISTVLFETRLGSLEEHVPTRTEEFIDAIGCMLHISDIMPVIPPSIRPYLPVYKRYIAAWDTLYDTAAELINEKMETINERLQKGEAVEGEYLTFLLSSGKMSLQEVYGNVTEMLLAGVDTTSNTISWALYQLAREPHYQERLYQEIRSIIPGDTTPDAESVSRMVYLKAVIKETLRKYPVIPGNARVAANGDVFVGGYRFPKKTIFHFCHYAVSHDPENFPEPKLFRPERWLRVAGRLPHHPFSSIPFGFGIRACLGRRIAELEMLLALSQILRAYEVHPDPEEKEEVTPVTRTLLIPGAKINLKFIERK